MSNPVGKENNRQLATAVRFGFVSLSLYVLLYLFEDEILRITTHGRWFFVLPILIAFLFSVVHGSFTSHFWEALGVKAKK